MSRTFTTWTRQLARRNSSQTQQPMLCRSPSLRENPTGNAASKALMGSLRRFSTGGIRAFAVATRVKTQRLRVVATTRGFRQATGTSCFITRRSPGEVTGKNIFLLGGEKFFHRPTAARSGPPAVRLCALHTSSLQNFKENIATVEIEEVAVDLPTRDDVLGAAASVTTVTTTKKKLAATRRKKNVEDVSKETSLSANLNNGVSLAVADPASSETKKKSTSAKKKSAKRVTAILENPSQPIDANRASQTDASQEAAATTRTTTAKKKKKKKSSEPKAVKAVDEMPSPIDPRTQPGFSDATSVLAFDPGYSNLGFVHLTTSGHILNWGRLEIVDRGVSYSVDDWSSTLVDTLIRILPDDFFARSGDVEGTAPTKNLHIVVEKQRATGRAMLAIARVAAAEAMIWGIFRGLTHSSGNRLITSASKSRKPNKDQDDDGAGTSKDEGRLAPRYNVTLTSMAGQNLSDRFGMGKETLRERIADGTLVYNSKVQPPNLTNEVLYALRKRVSVQYAQSITSLNPLPSTKSESESESETVGPMTDSASSESKLDTREIESLQQLAIGSTGDENGPPPFRIKFCSPHLSWKFGKDKKKDDWADCLLFAVRVAEEVIEARWRENHRPEKKTKKKKSVKK